YILDSGVIKLEFEIYMVRKELIEIKIYVRFILIYAFLYIIYKSARFIRKINLEEHPYENAL
ncbi:hypothetical protein, partial [Bacillus mycoides]|uniref:hypothetical protein n=1 Tax=Bacillus mycoides TaxID=1405 RepID=UPI0009CA98C0